MPDANYYLDTNLASHHWDRQVVAEKNLNEQNYGIGIERDKDKWRQMMGYYINSLAKPSWYALLGYTPLSYDTAIGKLQLGVVGGGVTGYPNMPVAPAAGLLASLSGKDFGVNLMATPSAKMGAAQAYGFAGLQARYKFK